MSIFTGAGVAIVTPFKEDLSVNYDKLAELIDYQVEQGTDSIIVCGTTGESSTLSHDEHIECIRFAVEYTNKRVPVIAGTGSNCTNTAIFLTKEAKKAGADATLVVTPYYNKATQKGLIEHFTEIAKVSDLPMILYNIPGRTGCTIQPETAAYLCKNVDTIVGMKDATGCISAVAQTMLHCEGMLDLYSGNDDQIVPLLSLGGKGVISVLSNIAPKDTHDIVETYLAGDTKKSLELQLKYLPLINALFCEVSPIPVKKALNFMGFEVGSLRRPLTEMEDAHAEVLLREMRKVGLVQ